MLHPDWTWFHCTTHTYGAWLYGDPRGFRTRHHREHVEGDYQNPPPQGRYDDKLERSLKLMKQPAVVIPKEFRPVIGHAIIEKLRDRLGAKLIALSVSGQHVHLLAKMPGGKIPRTWIGKAKKNATHAMTERGWQGELWAKRSKATPCRDRSHQVNVFHYILRHAEEGAWVWSFRDPLPVISSPQSPPVESPPVATGGLSTGEFSKPVTSTTTETRSNPETPPG